MTFQKYSEEKRNENAKKILKELKDRDLEEIPKDTYWWEYDTVKEFDLDKDIEKVSLKKTKEKLFYKQSTSRLHISKEREERKAPERTKKTEEEKETDKQSEDSAEEKETAEDFQIGELTVKNQSGLEVKSAELQDAKEDDSKKKDSKDAAGQDLVITIMDNQIQKTVNFRTGRGN